MTLCLDLRDFATNLGQPLLQVRKLGLAVGLAVGQGVDVLVLELDDPRAAFVEFLAQPIDLLLEEGKGILGRGCPLFDILLENARDVVIGHVGGDLGGTGVEADGRHRRPVRIGPAGRAGAERGPPLHLVHDLVRRHSTHAGKGVVPAGNGQEIGPGQETLLDDAELLGCADLHGRGGKFVGNLGRLDQEPGARRVELRQRHGQPDADAEGDDQAGQDQRKPLPPEAQIEFQIRHHVSVSVFTRATASGR